MNNHSLTGGSSACQDFIYC